MRRTRSEDQARIQELEKLCTQEDPPLCNAACPFHVDMRGVCAAAAEGDFKKGRGLLEQRLTLPRIMTRLCEAPCQSACKYGEIGDAIRTRQVAEACMRFGADAKKRQFFPKRTQKALVLGGGLSGLIAVVELAKKGFHVHMLHADETPVGSLKACIPERLTQELIDADLNVLQKLPVSFACVPTDQLDPNLYVKDETYQAIYISDDQYRVLADQGLVLEADSKLQQSTQWPNVFCGGKEVLEAPTFIGEAFRAKKAATSMDRFMQGVKMDQGREAEGPRETRLFTNLEGIQPKPAVETAGVFYTQEEAQKEAARCINCQCLECVKGCAYMQHYNKYPKVLANEFHNTLNFTLANRMHNIVINSCAECGQCKAICPMGCDLKEVVECSRRVMVGDSKMPPSAHEFALLDMQFSNSEAFFTVRHQPGHTESKYAFFPGCQLPATAPASMRAAYEDLASRLEGGVGLILGCCGAIGEWAQRTELFEEHLNQIKGAWEQLGNPEIITGCPTCYHIFRTFTDIPVTGIWQVMCEIGLPDTVQNGNGSTLSIHDSCGARNYQEIQDSVRRLASQMGYQVEEPKFSGAASPCCGFGGLTAFANPEVGTQMAEFAAGRCESRSLTYCANCRDRFAALERPTVHLLELLYGEQELKATGISQRRKNRLSVRAAMLNELWKEEVIVAEPDFKLIIPDKVKAVMEQRMILESDLVQVLQESEKDNRFILDVETGFLMASHRIGNVTFWAVFTKNEEGYVLENAYSYRMLAKEL